MHSAGPTAIEWEAPREMLARLRGINLDLLPVLHELLRTKSVTRTARSFNMTQPAVSRALRQLRLAFQDELLVSLGREVRLTERAQGLLGPLARAMEDLDVLLRPAVEFDPATEAVHLVINTADYVTQLLAPILNDICAREAPRVALEFVERGTRNAADLMQIDFMIGPRAFGETFGKRIGRLSLWRDDIVCVAAASNSAVPDRLTPAQFRATRYAAFRIDPRMPPEVRTLLQPTSPFEVAPICTVPNFLVLGAIVQQSDCIALVPRKVARTLALEGRLRIVEISFPRKQIFIDAFWSPVIDSRRGRAWFRKILARAAAQLP
jgi:LysR family transcriptional regulator, nod-box dependent transcriptional activator